MKVKLSLIVFLIIGLMGVAILSQSIYTVSETEQAIITQFGEIQGEPVTEAGLHFKMPYLQRVNMLEKRILAWDGQSSELPTKDKRFIEVDTFARWQIADPRQFFLRLRNIDIALSRLDDILDSATRKAIANHVLLEIVRSRNREAERSEVIEQIGAEIGTLRNISVGREKIMEMIVENAREPLEELGIRLLDVRLKRINYNQSVQQEIFERMISERRQIAERFRSEGQGSAARILGERERDLRRIRSEAYQKEQEIRGKADAEATRIYADAYNQNDASRDYYAFIKTMETFEATLEADTMLILSTDSQLFRYLKNMDGGVEAPAPGPRRSPNRPLGPLN